MPTISATKLLEHAVSICMLGPCRLNAQLSRLAMIQKVFPEAVYLDKRSGSFRDIILKSSAKDPVKTAHLYPLMVSRGIPAFKISHQPLKMASLNTVFKSAIRNFNFN